MTNGPTMLPDYGGGSILNLMRTVADACGVTGLPYAPARGIDAADLAAAETIVLLVVDGLGLDYVQHHGAEGALRRHLCGHLTSVFPSTTATAVTTFLTGLAPQQHGLTGWHMYFAELDRIAAVLPLTPRGGGPFDFEPGELPRRLFRHRSLASSMLRRAYALSPIDIVGSEFNRFHTEASMRCGYASLGEMFDRIAEIVMGSPGRKYVYAYYPALDANAHAFGIASAQVATIHGAVDHALDRLLERIRGSDTVVIATADHGFIDSPADRLIELERHAPLADMLARPLCGERRVAYCYVKPEMRADFEAYVRHHFAERTELHPSGALIEQGWFGPGEPHPSLLSRIGDYTLVMKGNWTIKDWLPGEKRYRQIGVHGGASAAEMLVPLVVAQA